MSAAFGLARRVHRSIYLTQINSHGFTRSFSIFGFSGKDLDVEAESKALHNDVLSPLNAKLLGPLEKFSEQLTPMPLVFILGNHSRCRRFPLALFAFDS